MRKRIKNLYCLSAVPSNICDEIAIILAKQCVRAQSRGFGISLTLSKTLIFYS